MTSPHPPMQMFAWHPPWRLLWGEAGLAVVLIILGLVFGVVAEWAWGASTWSAILAVLLWSLAALLLIMGCFFAFNICMLCSVFRRFMIVTVHSDSVWISDSPRVDLFFKTVVVRFETIVRVERERIDDQSEYLRIVHGPDLKTETVSEIRREDHDTLYTILAERCPNAFTPVPSVSPQPRSPDGV